MEFVVGIRCEMGIAQASENLHGVVVWLMMIEHFQWSFEVKKFSRKPIDDVHGYREGIIPIFQG